jgi:hypothetical protein
MTIDDDSWSEYFDAINVSSERMRVTVTLARVPLAPVRAGREADVGARGGYLEEIRYNRHADEIEICICRNGAGEASLRYFIPCPRSLTVEEHELSKVICITDSAGLRTVVSLVSARAGAWRLRDPRAGARRPRKGASADSRMTAQRTAPETSRVAMTSSCSEPPVSPER